MNKLYRGILICLKGTHYAVLVDANGKEIETVEAFKGATHDEIFMFAEDHINDMFRAEDDLAEREAEALLDDFDDSDWASAAFQEEYPEW